MMQLSFGASRSAVARFFVLAALLGLLLWAYAPGHEGDLLLDDLSSLATLEALTESPDRFWDFVVEDDAGPLGRPVAMFIFALEFTVLEGDFSAMKRMSVLWHGVAFIVLVVFLRLMLLARDREADWFWPAAIAASFWALTPQQTSTVLYLVQRMAMLSALFALASLSAYVYARVFAVALTSKVSWFLIATVFAILSVLSKENGLVVFPLILLLEVTWLEASGDRSSFSIRASRLRRFIFFLSLFSVVIFLLSSLSYFEGGYAKRSFTMSERLLSQPHAVIDYLRQFFVPETVRMGLYHDDFPVGDAAYYWSQLLQLCLVLLCIAAALLAIAFRRYAETAFVLLAFLGSHLAESSVLALEPYFEHRNYLPSVFLALALALVLRKLMVHFPAVAAPLAACSCVLIAVFSLTTSAQVVVWSNGNLLSLHHLSGHPGSARANSDMATRMARLGDYQRARAYSFRAYEAAQKHKAARYERDADFRLRNVVLACLAKATVPEKDLNLMGTVDSQRPLSNTITMENLVRYVRNKECPDYRWAVVADRLSAVYLAPDRTASASVAMYRAMATLNYELERLDDALRYLALAIDLGPAELGWLYLMQMQIFIEQDNLAAAREVKLRLMQMQQRGELNAGQASTLQLYGAL